MAVNFQPGAFYHVFNRGNNKEDIFIEDRNYFFFLNLMSKHLTTICDGYSYCLLKNHFHILLKFKEKEQLSSSYQDNNHLHQPFSNLFNSYTKSINKAYERTGSLFQEHLHKIWVYDIDYLRHLIGYIHLNPSKHGFSDDFKNYPYSSFQSILSSKPTKLFRDEVIQLFGDLENFIYWHDWKKIKTDGIIAEIEKIDN